MNVGKNISYLRNKEGFTQDELAKKIGVSRQTVYKWESGEVLPDSYNLVSLGKLFNITLDNLLLNSLDSNEDNILFIDSNTNKNMKKDKIIKIVLSSIVILMSFIVIGYFFRDKLFPIIIEPTIAQENEPVENIEKIYSNQLSAGRNFTVYIDNDGKINGFGENTYKQINFSNWEDIIQVSAGGFHTLGLTSKGNVLSTGYNEYGQLNVNSWANIKQVSAGRYHSLGLTDSGNVYCVGGENKYGQCEVSAWEDIIQISAGRYNSYGLKSDKTVISTNDNGYGQANILGWSDIIQISAGTYHVLGLKSDGTVVCAGGQKGDSVCNVGMWTNIKQVVGASYHTVGLKKDGTVVAIGNNSYGQTNTASWNKIISISAGRYHTVGLTDAETLVAIGSNSENQISFSTSATQTSTKSENNESENSEQEKKDPELVEQLTYNSIEYNLLAGGKTQFIQDSTINNITEAIYNPNEYLLSFKGNRKDYHVKMKCGDDQYVFDINTQNSEDKLVKIENELHEEILSRLCFYKDIEFEISEDLGVNDNRINKISKWSPVDGKYIYQKDFDNLFIKFAWIDIDQNSIVTSNIPGRLDVSLNQKGSDLDLKNALNNVHLVTDSPNIKEILQTSPEENKLYINSKFPFDDFDIEKVYYACNSVLSMKNDGSMLTICKMFKFDSIRLRLVNYIESENSKIFSFSRKWMETKNNGIYTYVINIPILNFSYVKTIGLNCTSSCSLREDLEIIKQDHDGKLNLIEIMDSKSIEEFTAFINVVVDRYGKYFTSDPYLYERVFSKNEYIEMYEKENQDDSTEQ